MGKIYYIAEVSDDDNCLLKTPNDLESDFVNIAIENLNEFSKKNIVVGYNLITGKVIRKTKADVFTYINSKRKLVGKSLIGDKYELEYHLNGRTITVTGEDLGFDLESIWYGISFSWEEIMHLSRSIEGFDEDDDRCHSITVELNIPTTKSIKSFELFDMHRDRFERNGDTFKINLVCKNKYMFKRTTSIFNLVNLPRKLVKEFSADFSECEFNDSYTHMMFNGLAEFNETPVDGNVFKNIKVNDSFYRCKHDNLGSMTMYSDVDTVKNLKMLAKKIKGNGVELTVSANSLRYSDILEILAENPEMSFRVATKMFLLDTKIDVNSDKEVPLYQKVDITAESVGILEGFDIELPYDEVMTLLDMVGSNTVKQDKIMSHGDECLYEYKFNYTKDEMMCDFESEVEEYYKDLLSKNKEGSFKHEQIATKLNNFTKVYEMLKDDNSNLNKYLEIFYGLRGRYVTRVLGEDMIKAKLVGYLILGLEEKSMQLGKANPLNSFSKILNC